MRRLAFGNQNVDFEKGNHPDNSWVKRQEGIEKWAVDVYNFMAKKYGEENIVAFVVHLDEKIRMFIALSYRLLTKTNCLGKK